MMQNKWASILNPLLGSPSIQTSILNNVILINGVNTINHLLGRNLVGWRIVRKRTSADIYDQQDTNSMPNLTLILVSDAPCSVDIEVF